MYFVNHDLEWCLTPNLSPYLNLLRGGNTAANYFIGVRPEQQRRQNAALFGLAINDLDKRTAGSPEEYAPSPPVSSGTYVYLSNTGPYFNNTGAYFPTAGRPQNSFGSAAQAKSGRKGPSGGTPSFAMRFAILARSSAFTRSFWKAASLAS